MERQAATKTTQAESPAETRAATREPAPESSGPTHWLLDRALGNRAIGRVLQAKLKVGPPGDRYEHEADRVAAQVMRMPDSQARPDPAETQADDLQVRRACRQCEEEALKHADENTVRRKRRQDDVQVRRACRHCEEEASEHSEDQAVQRKHRSTGESSAPTHSLDPQAFSSGGDPLPASVRSFYEARFDRHFGDVRVHTGPAAERYTDQLHAYAFTYGNHVWMGRGQSVQPSLLMAHELAHVVQQGQPPALGPRRKERTSPVALEDSAPIVRRFTPFWEPYDIRGGGGNHAMVLPAMGAHNKIFTEAPVPNADLLSDGFNKKADAANSLRELP